MSRFVDACQNRPCSRRNVRRITPSSFECNNRSALPKSKDCQSPAELSACVSISRVARRPSGRAPGAGGTATTSPRAAPELAEPEPACALTCAGAERKTAPKSGGGVFSSAVVAFAVSSLRCAAAAAAAASRSCCASNSSCCLSSRTASGASGSGAPCLIEADGSADAGTWGGFSLILTRPDAGVVAARHSDNLNV